MIYQINYQIFVQMGAGQAVAVNFVCGLKTAINYNSRLL